MSGFKSTTKAILRFACKFASVKRDLNFVLTKSMLENACSHKYELANRDKMEAACFLNKGNVSSGSSCKRTQDVLTT